MHCVYNCDDQSCLQGTFNTLQAWLIVTVVHTNYSCKIFWLNLYFTFVVKYRFSQAWKHLAQGCNKLTIKEKADLFFLDQKIKKWSIVSM